MKHDRPDNHLSAERMQAFLEGQLANSEQARVEEHLAACARCAAEVDGWRVLFEDLSELSRHTPHEGFADRVMAGVRTPAPHSLAARVRARVADGILAHSRDHVPADVLQDFCDGLLAARRAEQVEHHLGACHDCASEADAWLGVMRRLGELDTFAPSPAFSDRVIAGVDLAVERPLAARIRARVGALLGATPSKHVPTGLLQDWIEGALPARAMARVASHVDDCVVCTHEAEAWRGVVARLDGLEQLAPAEGFPDRVLHGLAAARAVVPNTAVAESPIAAALRRPGWSRAAAAAWRLVPQTREAWAALSGVAVTPAVVVGLVFYAVFSHPTLTLGSLASFVWWQLSDLASVAFAGLWTTAVQSAGGSGAATLFEALASAPALVAGGVLLYTVASALALRVLYKNLIGNRPSGRHAHVTFAS